MPLIFSDAAEIAALAGVITFEEPLELRLYQNNYTPVDTSVLGDFTDATFSGYAAAVPAMSTPTEIAGKATSVDAAARLFTHNGGGTTNTIYGYYVLNISGVVAWAERFPAPIVMASNGDQISITLQLTLDSANH